MNRHRVRSTGSRLRRGQQFDRTEEHQRPLLAHAKVHYQRTNSHAPDLHPQSRQPAKGLAEMSRGDLALVSDLTEGRPHLFPASFAGRPALDFPHCLRHRAGTPDLVGPSAIGVFRHV
jgi:hypothetical protein